MGRLSAPIDFDVGPFPSGLVVDEALQYNKDKRLTYQIQERMNHYDEKNDDTLRVLLLAWAA